MSPREIVVNNPEVYFGKILTASSLLGNVYKAGKLWFVALINEGLTVQTWIKEHWTKIYSVKYLLELELFYFWPEIASADSLGRPCIYWPRSLHLYSPITILYSTHNVLPIRLYISISSPKHFPWTPFHLTLPNMFRFRPIQPCCARKKERDEIKSRAIFICVRIISSGWKYFIWVRNVRLIWRVCWLIPSAAS